MKVNFRNEKVRIVAALAFSFLLTISIREIRSGSGSSPDFPCGKSMTREVSIEIKAGETGSSIATSLFSKGVVKSSQSFFRIAVSDSRSEQIAPGTHQIQRNICAQDALNQLLDSKRIVGLVNIVEGAWISEILPQLYTAGFAPADVASSLRSIKKPNGFTNTEGLLFPAQYSFAKGTSAEAAIASMVENANSAMQKAGFFSSGLKFSPQQLLIIASLLQAEGNTGDFGKISQVIRNRLKIGMPLQFDSTVHYIKKSRGSVFLSTQSTLISSPFNTYRRYGLPPGPINNPGLAAMRAATNPTPGNWLYFITVAPFDTRFTADIDQFNEWKIEYKKNLRAGKFRSSR
ncbi:MAG: endolytic transglycosylase MltG [Actinobacteria bacterium]|nr:endolytic transglycosylase MltG [Actinomycetota bacterium]